MSQSGLKYTQLSFYSDKKEQGKSIWKGIWKKSVTN